MHVQIHHLGQRAELGHVLVVATPEGECFKAGRTTIEVSRMRAYMLSQGVYASIGFGASRISTMEESVLMQRQDMLVQVHVRIIRRLAAFALEFFLAARLGPDGRRRLLARLKQHK